MITQYVHPKAQDFCERASNFLLKPAVAAAGRMIDVQTGLKFPQPHILTRVACAAFATLLFPVTLLGLALQYKSVTHGNHTLPNKFKPIALVVSKPNRKEVETPLLGDVKAACRDIGGSETHIVEWQTFEKMPGRLTHETQGVIEAKKLFEVYTVIFVSQASASWRLNRCFQSDGYFSSVPRDYVQNNQTFAITHHTPHSGYPSNTTWMLNKDGLPHTFVTTTYRAIPTVVWNVLNIARSSP